MSRPDTGSASALTKEAVMQEAQERVYRDSDDNRTGDVLGFGEWICDKLATCAGSLTDEQTLARAAELLDTQGLSPARDYAADNIRKLLAMSPAERPVLTDERTAFRDALLLVGRGEGESSVELSTIWAAAVQFVEARVAATERVAADDAPTPLDIETVRVIRSFVDRPGETYHGFIQRRLGIGFGRALRRAIEESGLAATSRSVER